ncbi:type II toxin-antitoxin system RelE/ParE family toxin [Reinekea sp.]|jgi:toxin ParE1/3/4|uniref:type II toxin-antitoxin system RelE/ParE family toxin n=1 Tax=Reinekea sp. TaxID=1970455 RepID=UPI003988E585
MPEYKLAPKAREDLESIWIYSMKHWELNQTERYIDDLIAAFRFLAKSPKAGIACDNIRRGYRKHPVMRHFIYYRETSYGVEVIRILHDRMLAARYF